MNPFEERLRLLEPRPLPDDLWVTVRSGRRVSRGSRCGLKEIVTLAAGLTFFASLFYFLLKTPPPGPERSPGTTPKSAPQDNEALSTLLQKLGSSQPGEREEAARQIKDRFPKARPDVLAALGDSNPLVGERASLLLAEMGEYESQVRDQLTHLLFHVFAEYEERRYGSAVRYVEALLAIDPNYAVARTLLEGLRKVRDGSQPPADWVSRVKTWKENLQLPGEPSPVASGILFPKFTLWSALEERIRSKELADIPGAPGEPCAFARSMTILVGKRAEASFDNVSLEKCLSVLGESSGLRIVTDPSIRAKADFGKPVVYKVADLSMRNILRLLLDHFGLSFEVTADGSIRVFERTKVGGK